MKNILNPMNPFFRFMNLVVDLVGVNLLFLLCCIPVITIGPALSALYTITMRLVRNTCETPVKSFWKAFRLNMKQGILLELIVLGIGALLLYNTWLTVQLRIDQPSTFHLILFVLCVICLVLSAAILVYLFPLLAQFNNTVKGILQNAFLMSIRHLPTTFCLAVIPIVVGWLAMRGVGIFAFISVALVLIGFVLIAYLQSLMLVRIFDTYIKQLNEEEEQAAIHKAEGALLETADLQQEESILQN